MFIARVERTTAYTGWQRHCKLSGGRHAGDDYTCEKFMDMPFVRIVREIPYEKRLARFICRLRADGVTSTAADFDVWCESDHVSKVWYTSNQEYWVLDIDFKIPLQQRIEGKLSSFGDWNNFKECSIPPLRRDEVYVMVTDW